MLETQEKTRFPRLSEAQRLGVAGVVALSVPARLQHRGVHRLRAGDARPRRKLPLLGMVRACGGLKLPSVRPKKNTTPFVYH